jgi:hypothetical protein
LALMPAGDVRHEPCINQPYDLNPGPGAASTAAHRAAGIMHLQCDHCFYHLPGH